MPNYMNLDSRIYVAGHTGLVGSAIVRCLRRHGFQNLTLRSRKELDLLDTDAVNKFFSVEKPEFVVLAAAKVGGILANDSYPAEFIRDNLIIQTNIIEASREEQVERLLFLGSSCIYPETLSAAHQRGIPLNWSARAHKSFLCDSQNCGHRDVLELQPPIWNKISCRNAYKSLWPRRYNFDLATSHVLAALIRKTIEAIETGAKEVMVWGTGSPRQLLYSDD